MNRNPYLLLVSLLIFGGASAQQNPGAPGKAAAQTLAPDHDTTYYRSFSGTIIARTYLSRSYLQFKMEPPAGIALMSYPVNKPLSLGVGLTYKSFSFSFSKGLNFLQSNKDKGETKSTDLQMHLYKRKWTIDLVASFYRGYYLNPRGLGVEDNHDYYVRPDVKIKMIGSSVHRVLNSKRFCYGAGLSQNAWQQRSAGSFLLGGKAFYITISGDSSFVPYSVDSNYYKSNIHKLHVFEIGPGIGYAYTLVLQKHYFLLGSFEENFNFRLSHETGNGIGATKVGFSANYMLRLAAGYNTNRWGLTLAWLTTGTKLQGKEFDYKYTITAGNYRLVYARRLAINRKMKNIIGPDVD
ncbi:MAG: hypothetical protein BGO55_15110 [Sphingobacteriales bacterium 50-39]|nr:DUF4421 family protein [Sphingobacteriales bacterium]OJW54704.1 MAG: hypothetical protein BGO55_15110 [Sphingobacteriales bacterium 50-39]